MQFKRANEVEVNNGDIVWIKAKVDGVYKTAIDVEVVDDAGNADWMFNIPKENILVEVREQEQDGTGEEQK